MKPGTKVYNWLNPDQARTLPCLLCQERTPGPLELCPACLTDLPWLGPACVQCARPLPQAGLCGACQRQPPPYQRSRAAFRYASPLSDLVVRLKHQRQLALARVLGVLLADHLAANVDCRPELILPVPLHPSRLRERGYNQAAELARPVAARLGIPLELGLLTRVRGTAILAGMAPEQRRHEVRGAFAVEPRPGLRHVALLDDVVTSGATTGEITRLLHRNGVERVEVWALARAGRGCR